MYYTSYHMILETLDFDALPLLFFFLLSLIDVFTVSVVVDVVVGGVHVGVGVSVGVVFFSFVPLLMMVMIVVVMITICCVPSIYINAPGRSSVVHAFACLLPTHIVRASSVNEKRTIPAAGKAASRLTTLLSMLNGQKSQF